MGIVAVYAGLTAGSGINFLLTAVDSEMMKYTLANAHNIDAGYTLSTMCFLFIMLAAVILISIIITLIVERFTAHRIEKYEYKEEKKELRLGKREYRGLIFSISAGAIYLLIFIYEIIPGLPLSGNLLDYSQTFYIDKLFSHDSFFSNGFVFIVTMFFIILGLFYGIGAKTIKKSNDFCEDLNHSLDGIGRTLILILLGSILINIFKKSNIGVVVAASLTNLLEGATITGIPLIITLFIISAISTLFLTGSAAKWAIISSVAVPMFMNSSLSPEFAQIIARFGECMTIGLTPLLAYFTIYISYIQKYNQNEKPISLFRTLKYQIPFSVVTGVILVVLLITWYLVGLPLGINGTIIT